MAVSYKKLWKLLIDKDIKKKDLSSMAGVSAVVVAENAEIEGGIVEKAKEQGINLLRSRAPIFETVLAIGRELGL